MFGQNAFLFSDWKIATATSGRSDYGHTFGGPHDRTGTSRDECGGILIHLLHRLNLDDPAIPFTVPGVRWLPFYYVFDFRVNSVGYQLNSDDSLQTFFPTDDPNVTDHEEWPDDDFPAEFPRSDIAVSPRDYDPTYLDDAYLWSGIFGIGKLSAKDQAAAKKRVSDELDELGFGRPETEHDYYEAFSSPFMQGKPNNTCLNPDCVYHAAAGQLSVIALMSGEPIKGVHTFGKSGDDVTLIFELCPKCYTIRVSNECT